ncbi:MAG TPA: MATE family efflux transporter [Candidatus Lachnoclostridium stercorigallinarum]|uniref:Probable multidrug resistance protein NorM n=1 Tax=Candidatus Lachnoclostridium stercorigallinarum TaxID=2838634 RepID=A0A9D2K4Z4_9FIRM|nr:MATE family efflux transporter [Candidatus Lachnoclostridium stercorigallinarum]
MNETFMKEKPVFPLILSMALPMIISMLVNSLYNIVDSFFVAQISEDAMTALSLVYPVQNLINAVAIGFGVGINAVIALHLGAGDKKGAESAAAHGFVLSALHGVIAMAVSILIMPSFLRMFTADETVVDLGVRYSNIAFSFSLFIMLGLFFEKLYQSVGMMKETMISLLCGCFTNIVLDPLLIFGIGFFPEMGIEGAALATGIGQVVTMAFYLAVYRLRHVTVRVNIRNFVWNKKMAFRLYAVGIPAALNLALASLLVSCLNALLAAYSQVYVVVLGIYYKLQTFLYLPASGIVQGIRPIIGYNYGAKEYGRVKSIYRITLGLSGLIMALGTVICMVAAEPIMGLFTGNPETIQAGGTALRIISAGFIVSAVSVTTSGALEGLGKGTQSLIISLCRYVVVILPAAFLLSRVMGANGVFHAFWLTEAVTAAAALAVYRKSVKLTA